MKKKEKKEMENMDNDASKTDMVSEGNKVNTENLSEKNSKEEKGDKEAVSSESQACCETKNDLESKLAEINDKYLRIYSEFDNYRKRTIKEKIELGKYANGELITSLLPVLDDFERALLLMARTPENEAIVTGVELIFNKFFKILEQQGLKAVNSKGEVFNTDFHEAVTKIPAENEEQKGRVYDEIQKGYILNDKVIRYAKVVVAE